LLCEIIFIRVDAVFANLPLLLCFLSGSSARADTWTELLVTIKAYLRITFILIAAADIAVAAETCALVYKNHIDIGDMRCVFAIALSCGKTHYLCSCVPSVNSIVDKIMRRTNLTINRIVRTTRSRITIVLTCSRLSSL
jgi:hypothetical protein